MHTHKAASAAICKTPTPAPVHGHPAPLLAAGGLLRLRQVLQLIPVSSSTWWAGVRDGRYPQPVKLSKSVTAWRADDIRALIEGGAPKAVQA